MHAAHRAREIDPFAKYLTIPTGTNPATAGVSKALPLTSGNLDSTKIVSRTSRPAISSAVASPGAVSTKTSPASKPATVTSAVGGINSRKGSGAGKNGTR